MTISNAAGSEVDKATAKPALVTGPNGNGADTLMQRLLRYPLRLIPRETVVPIIRGPLRGRKWIVGSFLHRCWLGSYEIEFQKALAKEIKRGGVFYDVGANVGFYSLLASKLIFPGRIYAFEPMTANIPDAERAELVARPKDGAQVRP